MNPINREKIATLCLVLCMFFNPLGFDALFKIVMELTGSYWTTDLIFYLTSGLFLGLYFFFRKINPITHIKTKIKKNGKKF
jgi:hypothetical protein